MEIIEYENGLPKDYLQKRKKKCLIYAYIWFHCLTNLYINCTVCLIF